MSEHVPTIVRESSSDADREDLTKKNALLSSNEMTPVQGTVDVAIPISVLWEAFTQASLWPRWNKCFYWAYNRDLRLGKKLIWIFQPIRWWYLYKMFAIAKIVELQEQRKVTWEVRALPGFYARHTYHMEDLGNGRTRFGSWEQAQGSQVRFSLTRKFWVAHFTFVKDRSLEGAKDLERIYQRDGKITRGNLKSKQHLGFWLSMIALLLLAAVLGAGSWFYVSYLRPTEISLAPGVDVVLAGGGNSLIVKDGSELLLLDPKFPPASGWLRKRIADHIGSPVTMIVNTHYHYDHTQGNLEFPGARIFAFQTVPELMRKRDGDWWKNNQQGMPTELVQGTQTIKVGSQEVVLNYSGPAHTHGDLWAYLRRGDKEIVATGDLVFNHYYPMMDLGEGGQDLPGLIKVVRLLASRYPNAVFVPGHGPLANASDVNRYADYLQFLYDSVAQARQRGMTEDQAVSSIDLSRWGLSRLPTYHNDKLCWSTAEMNIRWVYQIEAGTLQQREDCTL